MYASTPGFAPITIAWGWLALGLGIGFYVGIHTMTMLWVWMRPNNTPTVAAAPVGPQLTQWERAQLEVLRALQTGGRGALRNMAANAHTTDTAFLYHLAGLPAPLPNAARYAPY